MDRKVLADMAQRHQMAMPPECAAENLGPKKCGGTKFDVRELDDHGQPLTKCNDYQEVRIQEQVHRLTVGSIPRSITIVLQDDLVRVYRRNSTTGDDSNHRAVHAREPIVSCLSHLHHDSSQ